MAMMIQKTGLGLPMPRKLRMIKLKNLSKQNKSKGKPPLFVQVSLTSFHHVVGTTFVVEDKFEYIK